MCVRASLLHISCEKSADATFRFSYPFLARASRDREKEKSVEFANGSLLGNDSRNFVQHPGAYPLPRTRSSRFLTPPSSLSSSRRSFRPFLFSKVLLSRDTGVLHPSHFLLCSFSVLSLVVSPSLSRLDASYFLVRILNLSSPPISAKFLQ